MSTKETFKEWFCRWWEKEEPFGYDHQDTFDPIKSKFSEADNKITALQARAEELERQLRSSREITRIMGNANVDLKEENQRLKKEMEEYVNQQNQLLQSRLEEQKKAIHEALSAL